MFLAIWLIINTELYVNNYDSKSANVLQISYFINVSMNLWYIRLIQTDIFSLKYKFNASDYGEGLALNKSFQNAQMVYNLLLSCKIMSQYNSTCLYTFEFIYYLVDNKVPFVKLYTS